MKHPEQEQDAPALRTLNACAACHRQYDVSHLRPGARVRCDCGALFSAQFKAPRAPRPMRCANCGGNLKSDSKACPYCEAEVVLSERGLGSLCPGCWARLSDRAHFCMECGLAIQPQSLFALSDGSRCPRCKGGVDRRALAGTQIVECRSCGGLWLTAEHFEALCATADSQERAANELRERPAPVRPRSAAGEGYVPCLACGELMNRKNYASISGVVIDVCRKHGVWLDHAELERVLDFVRSGGLGQAREREMERWREERRRRSESAPMAGSLPPDFGPAQRVDPGSQLASWLVSLFFGTW